ncbi:protein-only RNase P [Nitzschia inconspicua]|uniref:Protein-only RNase P n=1 Tax=Nitzschia inconspicua TaxID=303405 RepID=A0A9K3LDN0_9STRA|nr:protein-only RNase P [Nitzschia inconspicua]
MQSIRQATSLRRACARQRHAPLCNPSNPTYYGRPSTCFSLFDNVHHQSSSSHRLTIRCFSKKAEDTPTASLKKKKKRLTLDEFFDNLSKQQEKQKSQNGATPFNEAQISRSLRRPSSLYSEPTTSSQGDASENEKKSSASTPRTDMASFFEQVDALVAKNRQLKAEQNGASPLLPFYKEKSDDDPIFDLLSPSKPKYDNTPHGKFLEMLDSMLEDPKFLRQHTSNPLTDEDAKPVIEWLKSTDTSVDISLDMLREALREGNNGSPSESSSDTVDSKNLFAGQLHQQRETFMKHHGWTKKQYDVASNALVRVGSLCAKLSTAPPLEVAWQKLKEAGCRMDQSVLHNYLYVSSTFSLPSARRLSSLPTRLTRNSGGSVLDFLDGLSGEPSPGTEETNDSIDVAAEVALCHDFLFEPSEQTLMIHVRVLVSQGRPNEAEKLLEASQKSDDLRLRTYAPVFEAYLDRGDLASAFKLFVKMKQGQNVQLQPETYVQLIACVAENGYFRHEADNIPEVTDLGCHHASGPALFDALASELALNSIEISSASAKLLYNSFQRGFEGSDNASNLKPMNMFESFQTLLDPAEPNELIVSRVRIDESSGTCSRSGSKLRLIGLDDDQKRQFKDGLLHLVASSYEERHKKKDGGQVATELRLFGEWLQDREGPPFTAIIDGPNVGYYMQNFEQGRFNFHQIKFVLDALEEMGENVLVVLPQRYMQDSFPIQITRRHRQRLRKDEREIRDDLVAQGKICVVPIGLLDDFYWMYASVSMNEEYIPPGNAEQRWPGIRPMLVSNDKLRDHAMSLLEPRLFRRWFSNFMVNFTFSAFVNDECVDREIGFRTADFYSREIQGNPVPCDNGNVDTVWHFPVADWDPNECLCIRIPNKRDKE